MTTTQITQAALKRFQKVKRDAEYNSMEEFLTDVVAFLEDHLEEFTDEYAEEDEDEE